MIKLTCRFFILQVHHLSIIKIIKKDYKKKVHERYQSLFKEEKEKK